MTKDGFAHENEINSLKKSIIILEQELSKVRDENDTSFRTKINEINITATVSVLLYIV